MADWKVNLIALVADGSTVRDSAKMLGIPERSAYRLSANPKFKRRVDKLRAMKFDSAFGKLSSGLSAAADKIVALLASKSDAIALKAAVELVELRSKMDKDANVLERLDALESRLPASTFSRNGINHA